MERILIMTGNSTANETLIRCVNMLFPDCEIRVVSRRLEGFKEAETAVSKNSRQTQRASIKRRRRSRNNTE